ncbi:hypothetical protein K8I28_16420 [bacterium]|nr:hypothetical protein [bacterium]
MKHLFSILKRIGIGSGLFLSTLIIAELFLRISGLGIYWNIDQNGLRSYPERIGNYADSANIICCFGNSLTFGMRLNEEDSYPAILQKICESNDISTSVVNSGIPGHTTVQSLERIKRDVIQYDPEWILIWLGTNDGMLVENPDPTINRPFDHPSLGVRSVLVTTLDGSSAIERFVAHFRKPDIEPDYYQPRVNFEMFKIAFNGIFERLKNKNIIVIGIPRIPDSFCPEEADFLELQRISHHKYDYFIRNACNQFDIQYLDPNELLDENCFLADGLHLNRKGNQRIANRVFDLLYLNEARE